MNEPMNTVLARAKFADWFYLRTGHKLTCKIGELAFRNFMDGKIIKLSKTGGVGKLDFK